MFFDFWKHKFTGWEPGEKIRIAVMYQVASYWPSIESFYQAGVEDKDVEIRIFYVDDLSVEKVQVERSGEFLSEKGIPFSIYSEDRIRQFRPHAALYQPPYDVSYRNPPALSVHLKRMGTRIIYIPYGIEIADTEDARFNHFYTFVVRNAWRIYTFSELMRRDYVKYCPNRHAVRALGLPKLDAAVHKEEICGDGIRKKADGRKVILWKLHFPKLIYEKQERKQVTPYIEEYLEFAGMVQNYKDLFFVVMPHPMFFSQTIHTELVQKAERLLGQLKEKENVFIDRREDYRISLYHADAVIVDRSALMVEAAFLDIPVLYMKNSDYEEPLTEAVEMLTDSYEQGTACADMQSFLERFTNNGLEAVTERIRSARERIWPDDSGKSGEKILEDIKNGIMDPDDGKIRISFFGASFICEHYINRLDIKRNQAFEVVCLSDNDRDKWGQARAGISIIPPDEMKVKDIDLIVITSEQYYMPIKKQLVYELCIEEEKIVRLDYFAEMYREVYMQDGEPI